MAWGPRSWQMRCVLGRESRFLVGLGALMNKLKVLELVISEF